MMYMNLSSYHFPPLLCERVDAMIPAVVVFIHYTNKGIVDVKVPHLTQV
jgi:hypothetical protein